MKIMSLLRIFSEGRDWSLITEWGEGGVHTQQEGVEGKVLAMLKGGHNKFCGNFNVATYLSHT